MFIHRGCQVQLPNHWFNLKSPAGWGCFTHICAVLAASAAEMDNFTCTVKWFVPDTGCSPENHNGVAVNYAGKQQCVEWHHCGRGNILESHYVAPDVSLSEWSVFVGVMVSWWCGTGVQFCQVKVLSMLFLIPFRTLQFPCWTSCSFSEPISPAWQGPPE